MRRSFVGLAALVLLFGGGVALATHAPDITHVCVNNARRTIRIVGGPGDCTAREIHLALATEASVRALESQIAQAQGEIADVQARVATLESQVAGTLQIIGLYTRSQAVETAESGSVFFGLDCDAGDVATGGGWELAHTTGIAFQQSRPNLGSGGVPVGWIFEVDNTRPNTVTGWVVCANLDA